MENDKPNTEEKVTIKKSTLWQIIAGILGILLIASIATGGFGLRSGSGIYQGPAQGDSGTVKLAIPSFVPFHGSGSAKINVIEFGDYQCPFCARFFTQTEPQIMKNYVTPGKARFYFMDFAFLGPDSTTLGEGAWCANDQGKYYDYHDYIYGHQGQEGAGWATADKLKAMVSSVSGLDTQKFNSCLDSGKYASRVAQLTELGKGAGVSGTPTTFIGNDKTGYKMLVGAQPFDAFKAAIDAAL